VTPLTAFILGMATVGLGAWVWFMAPLFGRWAWKVWAAWLHRIRTRRYLAWIHAESRRCAREVQR
jgi:hypothetical protein